MIQSILIYIVSVKLTWITCSHRETTFMGSYIRKYLQLFQTGLMYNVYDNRNTLVAQHWIVISMATILMLLGMILNSETYQDNYSLTTTYPTWINWHYNICFWLITITFATVIIIHWTKLIPPYQCMLHKQHTNLQLSIGATESFLLHHPKFTENKIDADEISSLPAQHDNTTQKTN